MFDGEHPLFASRCAAQDERVVRAGRDSLRLHDQQILDLVLYAQSQSFEFAYRVERGAERAGTRVDDAEVDALLGRTDTWPSRGPDSLLTSRGRCFVPLFRGENMLLPHTRSVVLEPESSTQTHYIVAVRRRDVRSTTSEECRYCIAPVQVHLPMADRWCAVTFAYDPADQQVAVRVRNTQTAVTVPLVSRHVTA